VTDDLSKRYSNRAIIVPARVLKRLEGTGLSLQQIRKVSKRVEQLRVKEEIKIVDVAVYILNRLGAMGTRKLQKLCYYCQAWSLVWDDRPLFEEEFHAWLTGPVCEELFELARGLYPINEKDVPSDMNKLGTLQRTTINTVLDYYGIHDSGWLGQLSTMEKPWKLAMEYGVGSIISKESMEWYYSGLD